MYILYITFLIRIIGSQSDVRACSSLRFDGYLMRTTHTSKVSPEHYQVTFHLVPHDFFDRRIVKKKEFLTTIEYNGALLIHDVVKTDSDYEILLSCCEGENIYLGYQKYKAKKYDSLVSFYKESMKTTYSKISSLTETLHIENGKSSYSLSINRTDIEYCYCQSLFGGGNRRYAYVKRIGKFETIGRGELTHIKNVFEKVISKSR